MDTSIVNPESSSQGSFPCFRPEMGEGSGGDFSRMPEDTNETGIDQEIILEQVLADQYVTQHCTRRCDESSETVNAFLRCRFAIHQQRSILHLPFVPAFHEIPDVICNVIDDHAGRIRVTERQKFGIRLELILERPVVEPTAVLIEVTAIASRQTN